MLKVSKLDSISFNDVNIDWFIVNNGSDDIDNKRFIDYASF